MEKRKRNKLIAIGIITGAVSVTALAALTSRILFSVAVKRKTLNVPEKIQDKLSGGLKTDPKTKSILVAADYAKSIETEKIKVTSHDGLSLTGSIYNCDTPKRIIIAMHGWRSSWQVDFGSSIEFYHNQDSLIVLPDQRGQNDSEGEYIGFGVLERHDCLAWINYAIERFGDKLPIYLCGVSMGATTVLMATGFKLPDSVKGIIADCGFTSPRKIWEHVLANNLRIGGKMAYPIVNSICKRKAQFDGEEYSTTDALSTNQKPVLFIHGSSDNFVPLQMTFENYLACNAEKELLIVPGASHGMSYITDTDAYEKAVKDFFLKHDK